MVTARFGKPKIAGIATDGGGPEYRWKIGSSLLNDTYAGTAFENLDTQCASSLHVRQYKAETHLFEFPRDPSINP
jgi:hypothetical protein